MKLIIFDIDGTLCDSKPIDDECYSKTISTCWGIINSELDWGKAKYSTDWGMCEELYEQNFNKKIPEIEFQIFQKQFIEYLKYEAKTFPEKFREIKGAVDFFHDLKKNSDYMIGIATGSWQASALVKLNAIGLNYKEIPFSNSSFFKSRDEIIKSVIEQAEIKNNGNSFESITYFGDGIWDFRSAKNLNLNFIGVDAHSTNILKKAGAGRVISSFSDFSF